MSDEHTEYNNTRQIVALAARRVVERIRFDQGGGVGTAIKVAFQMLAEEIEQIESGGLKTHPLDQSDRAAPRRARMATAARPPAYRSTGTTFARS